ncbi:receptor expression-enhancing protein 5-like [Gigantopelta aegis]|uniref:receptor expression-enhancing protein 5-like n=1 Tax=Gigantopelta aegis TaxID=1735272 RepID=UPI001B889C62|nr:receptor expression-enhancing protein 5-like [Gigantopelta aegis]
MADTRMEDTDHNDREYLPEVNPVNVQDRISRILSTVTAKRYIVIGLLTAVVVYLMVGHAAQLLCNFIGFVYPAYASVKAIETREKADDTKWLTYWVIYSVFTLLELFADVILFWIPFYWLFKCVFLLWCVSPIAYNGSSVLYSCVIKPFVLRHQRRVDHALQEGMAAINQVQNIAGTAVRNEAYKRLVNLPN